MTKVLIPFLAGLLFGPNKAWKLAVRMGLNPLFGGSAFRTASGVGQGQEEGS